MRIQNQVLLLLAVTGLGLSGGQSIAQASTKVSRLTTAAKFKKMKKALYRTWNGMDNDDMFKSTSLKKDISSVSNQNDKYHIVKNKKLVVTNQGLKTTYYFVKKQSVVLNKKVTYGWIREGGLVKVKPSSQWNKDFKFTAGMVNALPASKSKNNLNKAMKKIKKSKKYLVYTTDKDRAETQKLSAKGKATDVEQLTDVVNLKDLSGVPDALAGSQYSGSHIALHSTGGMTTKDFKAMIKTLGSKKFTNDYQKYKLKQTSLIPKSISDVLQAVKKSKQVKANIKDKAETAQAIVNVTKHAANHRKKHKKASFRATMNYFGKNGKSASAKLVKAKAKEKALLAAKAGKNALSKTKSKDLAAVRSTIARLDATERAWEFMKGYYDGELSQTAINQAMLKNTKILPIQLVLLVQSQQFYKHYHNRFGSTEGAALKEKFNEMNHLESDVLYGGEAELLDVGRKGIDLGATNEEINGYSISNPIFTTIVKDSRGLTVASLPIMFSSLNEASSSLMLDISRDTQDLDPFVG